MNISSSLPVIRYSRASAAFALVLTWAFVPVASASRQSSSGSSASSTAATKTHSGGAVKHASLGTSKHKSTAAATKHSSRRKKPVRPRGQQKIDSERAQAIQQALIREHYLSGEATGTWNEASTEAMRRYQSDHGWQTKEVPDSRALIKLGLGPSKDHLLNPDSAMTTSPDPPKSASLSVPSRSGPQHGSPTGSEPLLPASPATNNSLQPQK